MPRWADKEQDDGIGGKEPRDIDEVIQLMKGEIEMTVKFEGKGGTQLGQDDSESMPMRRITARKELRAWYG